MTSAGTQPGREDSSPHPPRPTAGTDGREAMNRIRELVLGEAHKVYDRRFAQIEARITQETESLRAGIERRFDELDQYLRAEVAGLEERLQLETAERQRIDRDRFEQNRAELDRITQQWRDSKQALSQVEQGFRRQLMALSQQLSDEFRQRCEAGSKVLDQTAAELRAAKTDRAQLASLFADLAMRLTDDEEPDAEDAAGEPAAGA